MHFFIIVALTTLFYIFCLLLRTTTILSMDTTEGFGVYLDRTLKKVQHTFLRTFIENDIDLTIEQWVILRRVHLLGPDASQAEISNTNFRNRATTSRVIRGLCKKGLLEKTRFGNDQKRYRLLMTDAGKNLMNKVMPLIKDIRKMSIKDISDYEFDIFLKVLDQIWENYDQYEANR
ncbi:MarR family transcriptional regulator [Maribacter sp. MJ134]|jgi:DNA-binding MarR family transcriptional regulator|nr:MarR family transcriptional regulator [Maribacter sp. MJ134]